MRFFIRLLISIGVIVFAAQIGRKFPSLAGLIAVMPLTGAIILIWLYSESQSPELMVRYTKAALWGILPSLLFFLTAFFCFQKQLTLPITLLISFAVWTAAAIIHQLLLSR